MFTNINFRVKFIINRRSSRRLLSRTAKQNTCFINLNAEIRCLQHPITYQGKIIVRWFTQINFRVRVRIRLELWLRLGLRLWVELGSGSGLGLGAGIRLGLAMWLVVSINSEKYFGSINSQVLKVVRGYDVKFWQMDHVYGIFLQIFYCGCEETPIIVLLV